MEFRLLGPVEVWSEGQRLDLGSRKQRFVLAVLALEVNRLVPVERLVGDQELSPAGWSSLFLLIELQFAPALGHATTT